MSLNQAHGFWPVASAVGGNLVVTILKFAAALTSGSSAMFSEAVHSLADTANQGLLLIGLGRSMKKADETFDYGYGNERFFWALISACGVLFVGAGFTAVHGLDALSSTHHITYSPIIFVVLAVSFVVEGYTFWVALKAITREHPESSWRERVAEADPSTIAVVLEDAVAVLGIVIATLAIMLSFLTGSGVWDAFGSLIISILLATVAVVLIVKNRVYLLGQRMPPEMEEEVIHLLNAEPAIEKVVDFKSQTIGFGVYRIKCEAEINGTVFFDEIWDRQNIRTVYSEVKGDLETFKRFLADYTDSIPRLVGNRIDAIEKRIKERFPAIRHIDIEVN